jgi:hypothetical protein
MAIVLGLDISTSCTGICVVDSTIPLDGKGSHILLLDKVEFKDCKTFFEKADKMEKTLLEIDEELKTDIDVIAIEEPLLGFSKGSSSAATITTLMRFNGIVSFIARRIHGIDPRYVSAATARKTCGIKVQQKKISGKPVKEQVFEHMCANDLKHVVWDKKKNGSPVDTARDMCDAYVIARAASLLF